MDCAIGSPERLAELERRYHRAVPFPHAFWRAGGGSQYAPSITFEQCRAPDAFAAQHDWSPLYPRFVEHLIAVDPWQLVDRLGEDGAYGQRTADVDGLTVSRDLLDSVYEIAYLAHALDWQQEQPVNVLDIGAGYGRLAHRLTSAMPNSTVYSTDAIARSTWLCEQYLAARGVPPERAPVVPFDRLDRALAGVRLDAAVNVHSWGECTIDAVRWWIRHLARWRVPRLLIVTIRPLTDWDGWSYARDLDDAGYRLLDCRRGDVDGSMFFLFGRVRQVTVRCDGPSRKAEQA